MAYEDYHYMTAGLPVAKNAGQSPGDEGQYHDIFYITAGLPPEVLTAAGSARAKVNSSLAHGRGRLAA